MVDVRHKFAMILVSVAGLGGALAASAPRILPYGVGVVMVGAAVLALIVLVIEGYLRGPQDEPAEA